MLMRSMAVNISSPLFIIDSRSNARFKLATSMHHLLSILLNILVKKSDNTIIFKINFLDDEHNTDSIHLTFVFFFYFRRPPLARILKELFHLNSLLACARHCEF